MSTWIQKVLTLAVALQLGGAALEAKADHNCPSSTISQYINTFYGGYTVLPLRRILGIGPEYSGRRIENVTLTASAEYSNATAQLVINGRAVGYPQTIGAYNQDLFFYPDYNSDEINEEAGTVQLVLNGNVRVDSVALRFSDCYEPGYSPRPLPPAPPYPGPYYPAPPAPPYPGPYYPPMPPRPMPPYPSYPGYPGGHDHGHWGHDHGGGHWGGFPGRPGDRDDDHRGFPGRPGDRDDDHRGGRR